MSKFRANGATPVSADCANVDPQSEVEHYVVCTVCGQIFDCRDARHLAHHTEALHNPLHLPPLEPRQKP